MSQEHIYLGLQSGDDIAGETERGRWNKAENNFSELYNRLSDKLFIGFLTQTSTNNPIVTTLIDTIGSPVFVRTDAGTYTCTKQGAFTVGKTTPNATGAIAYDIAGNKITAEWTSVNVITIKTYAAADTAVLSDDVLTNQEFHIEIYK